MHGGGGKYRTRLNRHKSRIKKLWSTSSMQLELSGSSQMRGDLCSYQPELAYVSKTQITD